MQLIKFIKAHGLGNDFVIIPATSQHITLASEQISAIANRRTGIGCDQLIIIEKSNRADCKMTIFNADGSLAEACGNATRCVALIQMREKSAKSTSIEINDNIFTASLANGKVSVSMGKSEFTWSKIPLLRPLEDLAANYFLPLRDPHVVNIGNPHIVFFVDDFAAYDLQKLGPRIENDPLFPNRINVSLARIIDQHNIEIRVWERGVGETSACGTAACAVAAIAVANKLTACTVDIHFASGVLSIDIAPDNSITMTGGAEIVFEGEYSHPPTVISA